MDSTQIIAGVTIQITQDTTTWGYEVTDTDGGNLETVTGFTTREGVEAAVQEIIDMLKASMVAWKAHFAA